MFPIGKFNPASPHSSRPRQAQLSHASPSNADPQHDRAYPVDPSTVAGPSRHVGHPPHAARPDAGSSSAVHRTLHQANDLSSYFSVEVPRHLLSFTVPPRADADFQMNDAYVLSMLRHLCEYPAQYDVKSVDGGGCTVRYSSEYAGETVTFGIDGHNNLQTMTSAWLGRTAQFARSRPIVPMPSQSQFTPTGPAHVPHMPTGTGPAPNTLPQRRYLQCRAHNSPLMRCRFLNPLSTDWPKEAHKRTYIRPPMAPKSTLESLRNWNGTMIDGISDTPPLF
jgi:hypothetical protein